MIKEMRAKTVLLIEDEADVRQAYQEGLTAAGYAVIQAGDAAAALRAIDASKPDIILLDLNLPHVSGLELLAAIQATDNGAHTPVIMLTNSDRLQDMLRSKRARVAAYFIKADTSLATLIKSIEKHTRPHGSLAHS